jgi:hypothetical protein
MNAARLALLLLWAALPAGASLIAADQKEEETAKTPEELLAASTAKTSVAGVFRFWPQSVTDGKPLPKLIGTITGQGPSYQVVVRDATTMGQLATRNGKKVIVSGTWFNAGDKGVFLMADGIVEADLPVPQRRKRGGL